MAGGKVDGAGGMTPQYLERYDRRGGIPFAQIGLDARTRQYPSRLLDEAPPHEAGIAGNNHPFVLFPGGDEVVGDGPDNHLDIVNNEVFAENAAPPGRSKSDSHDVALPNNKTSFVVLR